MLPGLAGHCRHNRRSTQSQRHSSWFCKVLQAQQWQFAIKEPCFLDLSSSPGTTVAAHNHSVMLPDFAGQSRLNSGRMQSQCHPSWFCRAVQAQNWQDAIPVSFFLVFWAVQAQQQDAINGNQRQDAIKCFLDLQGSAGTELAGCNQNIHTCHHKLCRRPASLCCCAALQQGSSPSAPGPVH